MIERETPFATDAEKYFFDRWKEAERQVDRLRREIDSLRQDFRRVSEMARIKQNRPESGLYGPPAILILLLLFIAPLAQADHIAISFGPSLNGTTNPKMASIGYEKGFGQGSALLSCGGMFSAPIVGFCSAVLSARVETAGGMFTRVGAGPAILTQTDDRLSSLGEFNLQGAVGWTSDGWDIGAVYNHFSNAGLVGPNFGRDFIGALIEIGL